MARLPLTARRALITAAALITTAFLGAPSAQAAAVLHIRGGGDGHGIGMSQYGAYGYALHGRGFRWILAHYYTGTALGHLTRTPTVRVLLASSQSVSFTGADSAGGVRLHADRSYSVRTVAGGEMALFDSRGHRAAVFQGAPLVVSGSGPLTVAGVGVYRGSLELRPDGSGGIETVDALDLEDYVRGVISAEMPASWSPAALEAQAVAARTYAITTDAGGGVFDQYSDTRSQMYGGVGAETPSTDAAVAATRDLVVTYAGSPAVTYFFNSSGGATENIENVWTGSSPEPWLKGVIDPYDAAGGDPYHSWGSDMTTSAAAAHLGSLVKGRFLGIRVLRHGFSPRIIVAQVVGSRGSTNVSGETLRQRFGLLTTFARFTTISTGLSAARSTPGPIGARRSGPNPPGGAKPPGGSSGPSGPGTSGPGTSGGAAAMSALVPLVRAMVASATKELSGRVFPATAGTGYVLERLDRRGWTPVARARLAGDGDFTIVPGHPGRYRILVAGLAGPVVSVP